jgi:hypothetical protein
LQGEVIGGNEHPGLRQSARRGLGGFDTQYQQDSRKRAAAKPVRAMQKLILLPLLLMAAPGANIQ